LFSIEFTFEVDITLEREEGHKRLEPIFWKYKSQEPTLLDLLFE